MNAGFRNGQDKSERGQRAASRQGRAARPTSSDIPGSAKRSDGQCPDPRDRRWLGCLWVHCSVGGLATILVQRRKQGLLPIGSVPDRDADRGKLVAQRIGGGVVTCGARDGASLEQLGRLPRAAKRPPAGPPRYPARALGRSRAGAPRAGYRSGRRRGRPRAPSQAPSAWRGRGRPHRRSERGSAPSARPQGQPRRPSLKRLGAAGQAGGSGMHGSGGEVELGAVVRGQGHVTDDERLMAEIGR